MTNRHLWQVTALVLAMACMTQQAVAQEGPTMGWSSWNTYGVNISADLIKRQADAMVSTGLKDCGYQFINIDDGYFGGRDKTTGQLLIHPTRFPDGLKPVVDYIHGKGLKAGIYSDAGHNTCGNYYNGDAIAVGVGLYEHDQQDCDFFFKELGIDFIKVDFCGGDAPQNSERLALDERTRYTAISNAIKNTGRDDVRLNVCRWDYPGTWVSDIAFSWRTTHDIANNWDSVKDIIRQNLYMSAYCRDGRFNDMDMLEVGRSLTTEEDKTHFGLWCMLNSPLLIGCDMTTIKSTALSLLKNEELIALNQDPLHEQAYPVASVNGCYVLVRDIEERQGTVRAFCVYNPTNAQVTVDVRMDDLDLGGEVQLRDLFTHSDLGAVSDRYSVSVPAHGLRIFRAVAAERLERRRYEAETAYISDYQEIRNNQAQETGIYEYADYCSSGMKAGWLGRKAQNDLQWEHVWSKTGGSYTMTIGYISGENRQMTVGVNGKRVKILTNLNSGGWQTVGTVSLDIELQPGDNVVRLYNLSAWMPDIDYMELECQTPTGIEKTTKNHVSSTAVYDLSGRRTTVNSKGLHIQNGRKFLHKTTD